MTSSNGCVLSRTFARDARPDIARASAGGGLFCPTPDSLCAFCFLLSLIRGQPFLRLYSVVTLRNANRNLPFRFFSPAPFGSLFVSSAASVDDLFDRIAHVLREHEWVY